jgi:hypothetical protein
MLGSLARRNGPLALWFSESLSPHETELPLSHSCPSQTSLDLGSGSGVGTVLPGYVASLPWPGVYVCFWADPCIPVSVRWCMTNCLPLWTFTTTQPSIFNHWIWATLLTSCSEEWCHHFSFLFCDFSLTPSSFLWPSGHWTWGCDWSCCWVLQLALCVLVMF